VTLGRLELRTKADRPVIAAQRQYIEIYASFVAFIEPGGAA